MIKEAVGTGNTVDEAKESALLSLGADAEADVQIEIIEMPKKKTLGIFGGSPAKVRVFIECPDKTEKPSQKKSNQKKEKKAPNAKVQKQPQQVKNEKSVQSEYGESVDESELSSDSKAYGAVNYLKNILKGLGCENTVIKVAEKENGALVSLDGEGLGVVIGRRGETLEALQMLASLSANTGGGYYRVNITVGDYREKREKALVALANRMAKQTLSTGKNRTLEPMSPYERRIIHTAVQEIDGVESNSIGEGDNRRVVIHLEGKKVEERHYSRSSRGRQSRGSNAVRVKSDREPMKDSDVPLYGRIEK
ncbi:MAG: Jag N-terminal domain-containing protein [Clostridia bacterium]|nr:Jag N-terminal domain-containing protein [Clostridia bacterium]